MDSREIVEKLRNLILEECGVYINKMDGMLLEEYELTSFDIILICTKIQEVFCVSLEFQDLEAIKTFRDMVSLLNIKLNGKEN